MKKLLLPALLTTLIISCNKKGDLPKTKTTLLTQFSWKFSAATVGGADASSAIEPCRKDNVLSFSANGTGTADEGAIKCNGTDPQTYAITWSFLSGETQIKILPLLFPTGSDTYTIITLTETQLILSQNMALPPPFGTQNVVVTFVH
jgi:hypothetical protein